MIGATARTYFDVVVRTLVLSFCFLAAKLLIYGQADHWVPVTPAVGTVNESFARFLILLIWATIAWGIARWVRRGRLARPGSSGAA